MARQEGFEPPTYCLEGNCSILLSYWRRSVLPQLALRVLKTLERVMGIEPTYPAWKAGVLPLNYTRRGALSTFGQEIIPYARAPCQHFYARFFHSSAEGDGRGEEERGKLLKRYKFPPIFLVDLAKRRGFFN